jgi:hypothetical protein
MKNAGHAKQMAAKQALLDSILAFISAQGAATVEQVSNHSGWTRGTTKKNLQDMRAAGLVHIGKWVWVDNCTQQVAAYALGRKPDAPQPISQRGLLCAGRKLSAEAQAIAEANLRHAKQMRNWKPHRDIAAAWF